MAEDPLQAEDIAAVCQERPRERVAKDMRRTARLQSRAAGEAVHKLIQTSRGQSVATRTCEQRIVVTDTAPMA